MRNRKGVFDLVYQRGQGKQLRTKKDIPSPNVLQDS